MVLPVLGAIIVFTSFAGYTHGFLQQAQFRTSLCNSLRPKVQQQRQHVNVFSKAPTSDESVDPGRHDDAVLSLSSRRTMITSAIVSVTMAMLSTDQTSTIAHASYGSSASIELPNAIDYLIERDQATKGAGTDLDSILYKGADRKVLLERLKVAAQRMSEIPGIAEKQKWSQINGILTGPLGELIVTMRQVMAGSVTTNTKELQLAMKTVQSDLYDIGTAANKKSYQGCYDGTGKQDLFKISVVLY